jgi:hypothetical protein
MTCTPVVSAERRQRRNPKARVAPDVTPTQATPQHLRS